MGTALDVGQGSTGLGLSQAPEGGLGFPISSASVHHRCLFNWHTGQWFHATDDRSRSQRRFDRLCKSLDAYADVYGLMVYFLTLTLSPENLECSAGELQRFVKFMLARIERATGEKAKYVWVLEVQPKRFVKYGVKARHWHLAVAVPDGSLPHVRFVEDARRHYQVVADGTVVPVADLYKGWGQGQVFCTKATTDVYRYLSKYISKQESYRWFGPRTRGYGSSMMGPGAWEAWTGEPIWAWQELGELEGRRVRKIGSRLELVELNVPKGAWCAVAHGECPGDVKRCDRCLAVVYHDLPRWRVVEGVPTPYQVVHEEDIGALVEARVRGAGKPALLTRSGGRADGDRGPFLPVATEGSIEGRGYPNDVVVEAEGFLRGVSRVSE